MIERPPPLTDTQCRETRRLRAMGKQHKQIARNVGCTPGQVVRYLRVLRDGGEAERRYGRKHDIIRRAAKKIATAQQAGRASLLPPLIAAEVVAARAERATAPLLRTWPEGLWE